MIKRKVLNFLQDFYFFLYFSDKREIIKNILNYIKAIKNRKRKFVFSLRHSQFIGNYHEMVTFLNSFLIADLRLKLLLSGKITTDVKDYLRFGITYKNKKVLDIGAWKGDSILLFHKLGAKKIIAYEPIKENVEFARKIVKKFNIDCKIYPYAVCNKKGEVEFYVEESEYGLGGMSLFKREVKKPKLVRVKCVNWRLVLENAIKERVDIAKVDCEGCEEFLVEVDKKLIRKISEWIIECHRLDTTKKIHKKFTNSGFELKKFYIYKFPEVNILYFKSKLSYFL